MGISSVAFTLASFVQSLTESELLAFSGTNGSMRQIGSCRGTRSSPATGGWAPWSARSWSAAGAVCRRRTVARAGRGDRGRGFFCVTGDATEEKVLLDAGLERAGADPAMPHDAENVFITLTARQISPDLLIIARAEQPSTVKKLKHAGADHVVLPAAIGAHRIVSLVTNPTAVQFAELVTQRTSLAIEMDDMPIKPSSPLDGPEPPRRRHQAPHRRDRRRHQARRRPLVFPPSGDEPSRRATASSSSAAGRTSSSSAASSRSRCESLLGIVRASLRSRTCRVCGKRSRSLATQKAWCVPSTRLGDAPENPSPLEPISAWRTGSSCGPSCGRTSSVRPCARRGSGSRRRGGRVRGRSGTLSRPAPGP